MSIGVEVEISQWVHEVKVRNWKDHCSNAADSRSKYFKIKHRHERLPDLLYKPSTKGPPRTYDCGKTYCIFAV